LQHLTVSSNDPAPLSNNNKRRATYISEEEEPKVCVCV